MDAEQQASPPLRPKYVSLDTSTWIGLFKHRTDPEVKDILDVLNSGQIICFVSFEHVLELVQYSVLQVRLEQLEFFELIKLISFPKPISFPAPWRNSPLCGSYLDLQESEISLLLENPNLTLESRPLTFPVSPHLTKRKKSYVKKRERVAGEVDVFPAEGRQVLKQAVALALIIGAHDNVGAYCPEHSSSLVGELNPAQINDCSRSLTKS
jgi:hypothetical protein